MPENVVVVGAGQAGSELATTLRQRGWSGGITLVGDEVSPPYQRPPLSKGYLLGKLSREKLYLKPAATYERFNIALRLGTWAETIDRAAKDSSPATAADCRTTNSSWRPEAARAA